MNILEQEKNALYVENAVYPRGFLLLSVWFRQGFTELVDSSAIGPNQF